MKLFHGHIYFDSSDSKFAKELYSKVSKLNGVKFSKIHETCVGPHPKPMIEIHFGEDSFKEIHEWLKKERKGLSILIHEETGNDVFDHSNNIHWLGEPLQIDFGFFEIIKKHPELRVHKED
jgi:DOPA 4,5-dioxygenase